MKYFIRITVTRDLSRHKPTEIYSWFIVLFIQILLCPSKDLVEIAIVTQPVEVFVLFMELNMISHWFIKINSIGYGDIYQKH